METPNHGPGHYYSRLPTSGNFLDSGGHLRDDEHVSADPAVSRPRDIWRREILDMDSFTAPACPDQPGSQRSRANNTSEQQLRLLLEGTNQLVSNLGFRDSLQAISSSVRRVMQCHATGVVLPEVSLSSVRRCVGIQRGLEG